MSTGELKGEKPPILSNEDILGGKVFGTAVYGLKPSELGNFRTIAEAQRDNDTIWYEAMIEQVKRDIFNKTVHAAEHRERFVIERAKAEMAKEIKDALENYWDSAKNRYWLKKEEMQSLIAKYGVEQ